MATNNAPAKRGESPIQALQAMLEKRAPAIRQVLAKHLTPERMARALVFEAGKTPALATCTPESWVRAFVTCAELSLEPGPAQHVHLIPRRDKKRQITEVHVLVGYRGLVELVMRTNRVRAIRAEAVHAQDRFEYRDGLVQELVHVPELAGERGDVIAAWAVVEMVDGSKACRVIGLDDIESRRSKGSDTGPWTSDYPAMARKSAIRALLASGCVRLSSEDRTLIRALDDEDERPVEAPASLALVELSDVAATALPETTEEAATAIEQEEPAKKTPPPATTDPIVMQARGYFGTDAEGRMRFRAVCEAVPELRGSKKIEDMSAEQRQILASILDEAAEANVPGGELAARLAKHIAATAPAAEGGEWD